MKKTAPHKILEKKKHEIRMKPDLAYYQQNKNKNVPYPDGAWTIARRGLQALLLR